MIHTYIQGVLGGICLTSAGHFCDYVDVSKHTYIQNCKVVEIMKTESLKNGNSFKLIDYQTHRKKGYSLLSL